MSVCYAIKIDRTPLFLIQLDTKEHLNVTVIGNCIFNGSGLGVCVMEPGGGGGVCRLAQALPATLIL